MEIVPKMSIYQRILSFTRIRKQYLINLISSKIVGFQGLLFIYENIQDIREVMGIFPMLGTLSPQYGNFILVLLYFWGFFDHLNWALQSTQGC